MTQKYNKINVSALLIFFIILVILFATPIKNLFGRTIGTFLPDILVVFLLINIMSTKIFYRKNNLDSLFFTLFIYVFLHGFGWAVVNLFNSKLRIGDLADYRNMLSCLIIYVAVRIDFTKNFNKSIQVYFKLFKILSLVLLVDIIFEYFVYKILGYSLEFLPWHTSKIGESMSVGTINYRMYGMANSLSRIPTLFGTPHPAGILAVSLSFVMMSGYHCFHVKSYKNLSIFLMISVFLIESRLQILTLVFLLFHFKKEVFKILFYKLKYTLNIYLISVIVLIVGIILTLSVYKERILVSSEGAFNFFYIGITEGNWGVVKTFITVPDIFTVFIGNGPFGGSMVWGELWDIGKIEAGIITEILPKFGVIFLFLYYLFFFFVYRYCRIYNCIIYFLPLFPVIISPLHFWLFNRTGVTHYYGLTIGIIVSLIIEKKRVSKVKQKVLNAT
ncbi:hypothetical protein OAG73_01635 [bacterium]|nr:hypothetical protein [bacterium]